MAEQQRMGPFGSLIGGGHIAFNDSALASRGVESISVGVHEGRIISIRVEYMMVDGTTQEILHGEEGQGTVEIGPFGKHQGYIRTVGGTYMPGSLQIPTGYITSLFFITSRGMTSTFGQPTQDLDEQNFLMTGRGETQLVALEGRFGFELISIGASFEMPRRAQGGLPDQGEAWDDGLFDGVVRITVGRSNQGIRSVRFEYEDGHTTRVGAEHGSVETNDEQFEIGIGNSVVAVEGWHSDQLITALKFRMQNGINHECVVADQGNQFVLAGDLGSRIIGFYGKLSTSGITLIGAHFSVATV